MFSDPDDFVSPQLMSVITRAVELDNQADMLVFKHFRVTEFNDKDWPVYDINNLKISDWTYPDNEDFCFSIAIDYLNVGGYPWNKVTKKEILQGKYFNESLYVMSDQPYFLDVVCGHKNMRICFMNYYLYCYLQHSTFGQTRVINKLYYKEGISGYIISMETELNIKGLPPRLIKQRKAAIYSESLAGLFKNPVKLSKESRQKLRENTRNFFMFYYCSPFFTTWDKVKKIIKQILVLLHINK